MPVGVNSGSVGSDDPVSTDLAVSMDAQVAKLDVDTTQLTTMLMRLPKKFAKSFKEEWHEDQYLPKHTALSVTAAAADTTLTLTTNEGSYAKAGDIGKFVQTGESFRITNVGASAWTVVRGIGSVGAATAASGTAQGGIIIVSGSNEEGADMPTALITQKTHNYNYTQIIRNSVEFTETSSWVEYHSGNPLAYHRKKVGEEHKREIENVIFFGARSYTAGTAHPRRTTGGIDEFLSTNITDVAGTLDKGAFADFLRSGLEYGNRNRKALFAAPLPAQVISEFLQDNWVQARPTDTAWGVKADAVISGIWGSRIPVFVKGDWKRYGEGSGKHIGSRAYLVDMENIEIRRAKSGEQGPRFATLYKNRQGTSADKTAEEWLSELAVVVKVEKAHALLRGVTG